MALPIAETWAGIEGMTERGIPGNRVHFIGVGGVGMSALAHVLAYQNYRVSGSDLSENRLTAGLAGLGVDIRLGHAAGNVEGADLVVVTSAVRPDNVEYLRAQELGLPIWHRARVLGAILSGMRSVVVAGTHGKTTVTSMIAKLTHQSGLDPTLIIGGEMAEFGGNARVGKSNLCVAEGDESDGSLLQLTAAFGVINSIDRDHMDHFRDLAEIEELFERFARGVRPDGQVWISADWPSCRALADKHPHPDLHLYGLSRDAELSASDIEPGPDGSRFTVREHDRAVGELRLAVPGRHNVHNALAAAGIGRSLGLTWDEIAAGLAEYHGVGRRFEHIGKAGGVSVIDDYAHHPAEIVVTLEALAAHAPGRKIGVFQPHRYSRTQVFMDDFANAFPELDHLFLTDIYGAGEPPIAGVTGERLCEAVKARRGGVEYVPDWQDVPEALLRFCRPGDTVVTLGAGTVSKIGPRLLELLRRRDEE